MCIIFMLILIVGLYRIEIFPKGIYENYIGREQTTAIKGLFALIIFCSHMRKYIDLGGVYQGQIYDYVLNSIGQLMVVMFLFYSGYGILETYKLKPDYEKSFIKRRFLKVLVHFDCAVFLYLIVDSILHIKYLPIDYLLCWIGWKAIGNSKWFVFDILLLYLVTYIAFKSIKWFSNKTEKIDKIKTLAISCLLETIFAIIILFFLKRNEGSWWYDTLLSFPCGMLFSCYKEKIEYLVKQNYVLTLTVNIIGFEIFYSINTFVTYNICACFFAMTIVLLTMKIKIQNNILNWLGKASFSIYILQRIPMIILSYLKVNRNVVMFTGLSFISVILIAILFEKFLNCLDNKIFC